MTDPLKRIEERHQPATDGQTCQVCDYSPEPPEPCDVVKLARALNETLPLLKLAALGEATDLMLEMAHASIERALEEVAK